MSLFGNMLSVWGYAKILAVVGLAVLTQAYNDELEEFLERKLLLKVSLFVWLFHTNSLANNFLQDTIIHGVLSSIWEFVGNFANSCNFLAFPADYQNCRISTLPLFPLFFGMPKMPGSCRECRNCQKFPDPGYVWRYNKKVTAQSVKKIYSFKIRQCVITTTKISMRHLDLRMIYLTTIAQGIHGFHKVVLSWKL